MSKPPCSNNTASVNENTLQLLLKRMDQIGTLIIRSVDNRPPQ